MKSKIYEVIIISFVYYYLRIIMLLGKFLEQIRYNLLCPSCVCFNLGLHHFGCFFSRLIIRFIVCFFSEEQVMMTKSRNLID